MFSQTWMELGGRFAQLYSRILRNLNIQPPAESLGHQFPLFPLEYVVSPLSTHLSLSPNTLLVCGSVSRRGRGLGPGGRLLPGVPVLRGQSGTRCSIAHPDLASPGHKAGGTFGLHKDPVVSSPGC